MKTILITFAIACIFTGCITDKVPTPGALKQGYINTKGAVIDNARIYLEAKKELKDLKENGLTLPEEG